MILQQHTEKELVAMVDALKKEVEQLRTQNKAVETQKIKPDLSVLPMIKKLSDRLKNTENKIDTIKPVVNNITQGLSDDEVLELIKKYVTMDFINKLYKKGK